MGCVLYSERDNMHTFLPGEIGLRDLGCAISQDANIGHNIGVQRGDQPNLLHFGSFYRNDELVMRLAAIL
jgi:hypothetical protein